MSDESREAFEKWHAAYYGCSPDEAPHGAKDDWTVWKARQPEIDALKTHIAELEAMTQWQPIETAPKNGSVFDACVRSGYRVPDVHWYAPQQKFVEYGCAVEVDATHWMPLPKLPQADGE